MVNQELSISDSANGDERMDAKWALNCFSKTVNWHKTTQVFN